MSAAPDMDRRTAIRRADESAAIDVLARTVWGEARGESVRGMEAVASVVVNRVRRAIARGGYWWGNDVVGVCLKPCQFSCWNDGDPNRDKLLADGPGDPVFDICLRIARQAVAGTLDEARTAGGWGKEWEGRGGS